MPVGFSASVIWLDRQTEKDDKNRQSVQKDIIFDLLKNKKINF
jgi:hypothetical protein